MQENLDFLEIRDRLTNAPDTTLKECCNIAGVSYHDANEKQCNITTILTSNDIDNTLNKISEVLNSEGITSNKVDVTLERNEATRAKLQSLPPSASSTLDKEMDPFYRSLVSDVKEKPSLPVNTSSQVEGVSTYAYLGVSNGWAVLRWNAPDVEDHDWVGLFINQDDDLNSYVSWQWVKNNKEYITNQYFVAGLSVRYYRYTNGSYQELFRSGNLDLAYSLRVEEEKSIYCGCWIAPTITSYASIRYKVNPNVKYDFVGLYKDNTDNYLTWQWANFIGPYDTSYGLQPGYHARYYEWDSTSKKYICRRSSFPIATSYLDVGSIYPQTHSIVKRDANTNEVSDSMWEIFLNQLLRAAKGEPSIFSLGFYPMNGVPFLGQNLLWHNLSFDEVQVIVSKLRVNQYIPCLKIYYQTYRMAIIITDDNERNAKRHVFWQIAMAQSFGEAFAIAIGDAHERGRPGSTADNDADAYNNKLALDYWRKNPQVSAIDAANKLWNDKALKNVEEQRLKDEL